MNTPNEPITPRTSRSVLIVTTAASMIAQFLIPHIQWLRQEGFQVSVACNFENGNTCDREETDRLKQTLSSIGADLFQIPFSRRAADFSAHIRAYREIRTLIDHGKFDLVHCHTPTAGVLCRLACRRARKRGTKSFYTAHGFYFYRAAPKKAYLLYYPIEKFCARFTDVLITINREDYETARRHFSAKRVEYIPGVGIDTARFETAKTDRDETRTAVGVRNSEIFCLSVGELDPKKNHATALHAVAKNDVFYAIAGIGPLKDRLQSQISEMHLNDRVRLLGYRNDIDALCRAADIFVFPSIREGLPVALMEAMAAGLPCVVANIRGNTDLIEDGKGGFLCDPNDPESFAKAIRTLAENPELRREMGESNRQKVRQFDLETVQNAMIKLYRSELGGKSNE